MKRKPQKRRVYALVAPCALCLGQQFHTNVNKVHFRIACFRDRLVIRKCPNRRKKSNPMSLGHVASRSSACSMIIQNPVLVSRTILRGTLNEGIISSRNLAATFLSHTSCMISSIACTEIVDGNLHPKLWNLVSHSLSYKCPVSFLFPFVRCADILIGDEGAKALAGALKKNPALTSLQFWGVQYAFPNPKSYRPFPTRPMMV